MPTSIARSRNVSRRRILALGGSVAGSWMARNASGADPRIVPGGLGNVESILQAQGKMTHGLLSVEIERHDIKNVTLHGVPIKPAFQINGAV